MGRVTLVLSPSLSLSLFLFPSLVQTEYWISITTGEADIEGFCSSTSFANSMTMVVLFLAGG